MSRLSQFALAIAFAGVMYFMQPSIHAEDLSGKLAADNVVVMYSLTTCPYCRKTREWLTKSHIPFQERFLDADEKYMREFNELLAASGAPPGAVGTPTLVVNDVLLINNPEFKRIRQHLRFKEG